MGHKEVVCMQGKIHEYHGMRLDYSEEGKIITDMRDYVQEMIE